ncbi:YufK family protein [Salisediminibacterium selenitireducens]|uniref:Yip1 domain-containing protein n=1 Tax=Bacillus selenitireducens (strain ATCC 700615 / DSM 15326 / MLS10) TaxID=439292 RepID=D6XXL7_BACIE|nr:YufK family protein [Salisediminibacterium selenitireducens]ADI00060.1 hypothetical protein Bsel_2559 [[Bacillus] selenitireducens MLS10]
MKNAYLTSHFPLISILLYSLSFAMYASRFVIRYMDELGLYSGMIEFFSESGIQLTMLAVLWLFFFMLFAALKLIADTINELSLLFFSKDEDGADLNRVRGGAWIFLLTSIVSLLGQVQLPVLLGIFLTACVIYFVYFIYKISEKLSFGASIGLVMFHLLFWGVFVLGVTYAILKLYNSIIASLPI